MITAFFTQILIKSDGSVDPSEFRPRVPFPQIILAEVIDNQIIHYSLVADNQGRHVLDVKNAEDLEGDAVRDRLVERYLAPADFIAHYGITRIRTDLAASVMSRYPTGSSQVEAVVALDMIVRGPESAINNAIAMTKPEPFFEALQSATEFYPGIGSELTPYTEQIAKAAFRGSKAKDLVSNLTLWELRMEKGGIQQLILVEEVIRQLLDHDGTAIRTIINPLLLDAVLRHPKIAEVEACNVNSEILDKAETLGVSFRTTRVYSPVALKHKDSWRFIKAGYDWRLHPELAMYRPEQETAGCLASYIRKGVTNTVGFSTNSNAFWHTPSDLIDHNAKRLVRAISQADPEGFAVSFEMLREKEKLACVASGFVDRSWVDIESIPQAGLASMLENDLGL